MGLLAPKGIFHIKKTALLVGNFEKNPYQDPASCAWLEVFFTPKMYQFLTNTFLLSVTFFFSVCYPEMYPKSSRIEPFEA